MKNLFRKIISVGLALMMTLNYLQIGELKVDATANFTPRTTEPSYSDPHWIHTSYGGLNECLLISGNSVLPNCVGYAWGRAYEILGSRPNLSRGNAGDWYWYNISNNCYAYGNTPKLGAIACWGNHVAVVEEIYSDGKVLLSQSHYGGKRFDPVVTYPPTYTSNFQGYIYIGEFNTPTYDYSSITPGTYFIVSKSDGKALTLGNNEDYNTNNIHMYDTTWTNRGQYMVVTEAPDGYKIRPIDSTRLVNPYGDYAASGENINIYADVNDNSQWWKFQKVDGGYVIRNTQNPNLVIDNSQSDNAVLWECNGGANQVWELVPVTAPGKPVITDVKSSYETSESVIVKWNSTSDTNQYNIAVEKKTNGEYKEIYWKDNISSGYTLNSVMTLDPGDYRVRVASVNNKVLNGDYYLSTIGDYVNFTVKEKAQTYTVAFNANGGSGTMSSVTMTYGVAQNLPANTFTRSGYTFLGWSKDKNATTATYTDKQSVKNLASRGTVTLYAIWKNNASIVSGDFDISVKTENKTVISEIRFSINDGQPGLQSLTYTVQFDPKVLKYSEDSYFPYASTNVNTKRADEGIIIVTTILTADPDESFSGAYLSTMLFDIVTSDPCTTSIKISANDAYGNEGTEIAISSKTVNISLNESKLGDINGDGKVNSLDALWALQAASENRTLTLSQFLAADVNMDGKVNSLDALWILQAASGNRQL